MPEPVRGLWYFSLPYRARELRSHLYLAHWLTPGRQGHVSLIFDLDAKHVDCSALMPGKFELWDRAFYKKYKTSGEGALYSKPPTEKPETW